jgi:hypothetical protein
VVAAVFRRIFGVVLLTTLLGVGGGAAAMSVASAAPHAPQAVGSAPGEKPTSYTPGHQTRGEHFTRYCVKNYKPNSTVKVINKKTGQVVYIHTNSHGAGCVEVPVTTGCQRIVAHGQNRAGQPADSSVQVCVLGEKVHRSSHGALPFTGSNIIIPGLMIGGALLAVGALITILARRRRAAAVA